MAADSDELTIDGSEGEGGGQILRSSLSLSLLTSKPFRMTNIRARRRPSGLRRQHVAAIEAARAIGEAEVEGVREGSSEIRFRPRSIRGGEHRFAIGTAGSATLVFQTVFLPLLVGTSTDSRVVFEGGTDNPMAPPFEFLAETFLETIALMTESASVSLTLERHGFYPAGGGRFRANIHPATGLRRLELLDRGDIVSRSATAIVSRLPKSVADRELATIAKELGWDPSVCRAIVVDAAGPGNVMWTKIQTETITEVIAACGEKGVPAEKVAEGVAEATRQFEDANVPVGEHLADQLLLPMALGKGGSFRTVQPTLHTTTQIDSIRRFLDKRIEITPEPGGAFRVDVD